jgi:hypothetical protein
VTRAATLVGEEANGDLALIRIDPGGLGLKPLNLVNSSSVQVGDAVYAIGNPYGLDETLTRGIVSELGLEITAPDGGKVTGAIQTYAALNPGNSGAPRALAQRAGVAKMSGPAPDEASAHSPARPSRSGGAPFPAPRNVFQRIGGRAVQQLAARTEPADVMIQGIFDQRSRRGWALPGKVPPDDVEVVRQDLQARMLSHRQIRSTCARLSCA